MVRDLRENCLNLELRFVNQVLKVRVSNSKGLHQQDLERVKNLLPDLIPGGEVYAALQYGIAIDLIRTDNLRVASATRSTRAPRRGFHTCRDHLTLWWRILLKASL